MLAWLLGVTVKDSLPEFGRYFEEVVRVDRNGRRGVLRRRAGIRVTQADIRDWPDEIMRLVLCSSYRFTTDVDAEPLLILGRTYKV